MGRTPQFTEVLMDSDQPVGAIVMAEIGGVQGPQLLGRSAEPR